MYNWQRNLYASWAAQMLALVGFSATIPFIPLYLQDIGVHSKEDASFLTGIMTSLSFLGMGFFAPIWGMLADRFGRKPMVFRAMLTGSVLVGLMGLTDQVWQLLILRILQGIFTGSVPASIAFVSSIVPQNRMGYALGLMQTAVFTGLSVGPLVGGLVGDTLGHRYIFLFTAVLLIIASIIVWFVVQENFQRPVGLPKISFSKALFGNIGEAFHTSGVMAMAIVLALIQLTNVLILPILPVYVQNLGTLSPEIGISTTLGIISAISGIAAAVASILTGRLSDRFGPYILLVVMAFGASFFTFLQAFVGDSLQLTLTRCAAGLFLGGILPAANAVVSRVTPPERRGATFGFVNMIGSIGLSIGPITGATLAVLWSPQVAFLTNAFLLVVIALWVGYGPPRRVIANLPPLSPKPIAASVSAAPKDE